MTLTMLQQVQHPVFSSMFVGFSISHHERSTNLIYYCKSDITTFVIHPFSIKIIHILSIFSIFDVIAGLQSIIGNEDLLKLLNMKELHPVFDFILKVLVQQKAGEAWLQQQIYEVVNCTCNIVIEPLYS